MKKLVFAFFLYYIFIPPVYEVCRGYIVIPPVYEVYMGYSFCFFRVSVCVCVCKLFFFVKDFSGTTVPRILKFGTNIGYDKLYCVLKNQPQMAY